MVGHCSAVHGVEHIAQSLQTLRSALLHMPRFLYPRCHFFVLPRSNPLERELLLVESDSEDMAGPPCLGGLE